MAMKKCKECGNEISSSAKVCPNCGKKQKISGCLIAVIIVVLIIIIIATSGNENNTTSTSSSNTTSSVKTPEIIEYTSIDVDILNDALENNAASAKATYYGNYYEITGKLGTIDSDLAYLSLFSTTDEWDFSGIHCSIMNENQKQIIQTLNKNDIIVVKGKITEVGELLGYTLEIEDIYKK